MIPFTKVLAADFYKTRRTGNLLLSILTPLLSTLVVFTYFAYKAGTNPVLKEGADSWMTYAKMILAMDVLLMPLFAAVISFSMSNVEHKNRGLKQIFTLPARKSSIYFSKVVILLGWVAFSLVFAMGILYGSGALLGGIFPFLHVDQSGSFPHLLEFMFKVYVTLVAIVAIHFFISIYWNNFVVSVGSACFLVVMGLGMASWDYSYVFPYAHIPQAMSMLEEGAQDFMSTEVLWSLGYAVLFFGFGYWMMLKKSIRS